MSYEQLAQAVDNLAVSNATLAQSASTTLEASRIAADKAETASTRATVAAEVAQQATGIYDTVALGLAATTTGKYFSVPSLDVATYLVLYKNDTGAAVYVDTYPSKTAIDEIGIEEQSSEVSGLSFSIVDDANSRTWLEADLAGKPSEYSANKIGEALTATTAPVLFKTIKDSAVLEAVVSMGIEPLSELNNQSFAIVADNDQRLWLEADLTGGPTPYAATKIGASLTEAMVPVLSEGIVGKAIEGSLAATGFETLSELNDQAFSLVDDDGRRLWLEAGPDGKPSTYAMQCIVDKLPNDIGGAPSTYNAARKGILKIVSGPNFTAIGDSMTAGAGGAGTTYPRVLKNLLVAAGYVGEVNNRGVGGENSVTITARMGGYPFMVLPVGGVIPATTTPFEITLLPINGQMPAPLKQGYLTYTGKLGKVPGTFSRTESGGVLTYYFTRTVAGDEVVANRPTQMYLDIAEPSRGDVLLIWIGQNGPDTTRAIQDAKALIQRMTALDKRYLVIGKPGGTSAQNVDDSLWFAEFGQRFISIRQYMVQYGLADAGLTPTSQDLIDIQNGTIPSSLRVDSTHWIAAGYTILGNLVFQRLIEMEWI